MFKNIDLNMIVAYDLNRGIGKDGDIPWHLPEDLKWFKDLTEGNICIMGRKTYDGIVKQGERFKYGLPNRNNMVLTSKGPFCCRKTQGGFGYTTCYFNHVNYIERHIELDILENNLNRKVFVIGGGEVYKHMLPYTKTIYATQIKQIYECDVHFPLLDSSKWRLDSFEDYANRSICKFVRI